MRAPPGKPCCSGEGPFKALWNCLIRQTAIPAPSRNLFSVPGGAVSGASFCLPAGEAACFGSSVRDGAAASSGRPSGTACGRRRGNLTAKESAGKIRAAIREWISLRFRINKILHRFGNNGVGLHGGKSVIRRVQSGQANVLAQCPYPYLMDCGGAGYIQINLAQ